MAGLRFAGQTDEIATGTALLTVMQLVAAANHRILIREWSISFQGIAAAGVPILVEVLRQTTAGTMSSDVAPKWLDNDISETMQTTMRHLATVEPTRGDVLFSEMVHPQTGYTWKAAPGEEIHVGGGDRIAIATTAAASVGCFARMVGEE